MKPKPIKHTPKEGDCLLIKKRPCDDSPYIKVRVEEIVDGRFFKMNDAARFQIEWLDITEFKVYSVIPDTTSTDCR